MISVIFTIDYEIYGNGEGSLKDLVYEPTRQLMELFNRYGAKLVVFAEVAELEKIAAYASDADIENVEAQIRLLHRNGHEIALHLHPQWFNAEYKDGYWRLDYSEYNLCGLPKERIILIIKQALAYLRKILDDPEFKPFSFRAGNWLFQPTEPAAEILAEHGMKVDSSVFKGGLQYKHGLDYRSALKNDHWWTFTHDVNTPEPNGILTEIPIYTRMVPFWQMVTAKRMGLQKKANSSGKTTIKDKFFRLLDRARLRHPMKFDFCRMTYNELTDVIDTVVHEDEKTPYVFKPVVAIGHSKDLVDFDTVERFLEYLARKNIHTSAFKDIYPKFKYILSERLNYGSRS